MTKFAEYRDEYVDYDCTSTPIVSVELEDGRDIEVCDDCRGIC